MNRQVVHERPDRLLTKEIITPGDYNVVAYEDARCKVTLSKVACTNEAGSCDIETQSRIFNKDFDGVFLMGDLDCFIDRDFEMIVHQMCRGETCLARLVYKDGNGQLVKEISCKISLDEVMEEQLVSDWGWTRLLEAALHHKARGVELVQEGAMADAFRRFNKALKMLIAIEPVNTDKIDEEKVKEMIKLKVKLLNNLCHCQLHYKEYEAAIELCNCTLKYDSSNIKALYRRSSAHFGLNNYEAAWGDIQEVLKMDPNDKAALQKAAQIEPKMQKVDKEYKNVIKKMFN